MRLVLYLRSSTDDPGDRLDRQEDACRQWAAQHQHVVVDVFRDNGLSGKLPVEERPGLLAALGALDDDQANGVLVHRLDRLARQFHLQEAALLMAWGSGGQVMASDVGLIAADDPDDPMRTFLRQVMGAVHQLERGMVVVRMKDGRKRKHGRGGYMGGPTLKWGERVEGRGKDAVRVLDDTAAATLVHVRQLRAVDGLTLQQIGGPAQRAGDPDPARRALAPHVRPPGAVMRRLFVITVPWWLALGALGLVASVAVVLLVAAAVLAVGGFAVVLLIDVITRRQAERWAARQRGGRADDRPVPHGEGRWDMWP